MEPTQSTYDQLLDAYKTYNDHLFDNELPACLITLRQKKGRKRLFLGWCRQSPEDQKADEIALDIALFHQRTTAETLSTLAHEMVHLWQFHCGKPGKNGYHNRQWAEKMHEIGLCPTSTGVIGGKETGTKITHVIVPDGLFDRVTKECLEHAALLWAIPDQSVAKKETKQGKRQKYECPECGLIAYARFDAAIICGEDSVELRPFEN